MASDVRDPLRRLSFAGLWLFAAVACLSIAAQNVLFLGFAAWAWLLLKEKRRPWTPAPMGGWDLFVLWALAASLMSDNSSHSLLTWKKWLLGFTVFYSGGAIESRRDLKSVLGALLFFGGLTCLGAVLWSLRGPLSSGFPLSQILSEWANRGEWRAVSGSGGYMVLGTCSMLLLVFYGALWLKDEAWRSWLNAFCLASAALALLMTQTRSAWAGALAGASVLLWTWKKGAALALLAALAFVVLAFPSSPISKRVRDGLDTSQNSARERIFMAQTGAAIIRQHPWFGVGDALESFDGHPGYYLNNFPEAGKAWESLRGKDEGHLHNNFLQVAVMYGIPALLLLLLFFGRLAWISLSGPSPLGLPLALALLAWFVNGLFEFNFGSLQSSFVLWFLVGLTFSGARLYERPSH